MSWLEDMGIAVEVDEDLSPGVWWITEGEGLPLGIGILSDPPDALLASG